MTDTNWENNSFDESQGNHLGNSNLIEKKFTMKKSPSAIIAGSRGGQVTGKVGRDGGSTIIINGTLTSQTIIPKQVHALFIENDYFKSVNLLKKSQNLKKYKERSKN